MAGVEVRRRRGKEVSLGRRLLSLVADWAVEIAAPWDEVWAEMGTTISEDAGWAEIDEIGGGKTRTTVVLNGYRDRSDMVVMGGEIGKKKNWLEKK
ncbi:hypothetical protein M0R45_008885 [Rubus argutus]|uniref:Uncharacterized protein n=1 Tax=Rubus argutus TaxID=59490 RepID=A0AAW1Y485_RUBAR